MFLPAISPASKAAALYAAVCWLHLILFHTEPPVMVMNAMALLILPVYARKLQWPQRYTYKTIGYYLVWVQVSMINVFSAYMETFIVVFLFLCVQHALGKQSTTTLLPTDNTGPPSMPKKGPSAASDPVALIITREETMPHADLKPETFDSQVSIKAWPFKAIAAMIVFVAISALADSYYTSWDDSLSLLSGGKAHKSMSHTFRTLTTQVYFVIVLTAVQTCVMLPSKVFKLAWISVVAGVHKGYAALYFVPANLIFFLAVQWTMYSTAFRFVYPLWDFFFFTGPHFALILAFVRSLYLNAAQFTSKTATEAADSDSKLREMLVRHQEAVSVLDGGQQAETTDSKGAYAAPENLTIRNSIKLDEAEIDIADLSTPPYIVEMLPDIEDHL